MDIESTQCGSYTVIKTLGSGFHAKVKLAQANHEYFAIKVFKNNHALASNIKALANEIKVMQQINHPNLVNLIEFNESMPYKKKNGNKDSRVCIVLELAQGGELFEYVAQTGRFSEETSRFYFKQLLEALSYLHSKGIAHRDLKPENLLFDSNFNLKVADFGFSTLFDKYNDGKLRTVLGTEGYMAPEIHTKQPYDGKSVDIFASAIVLFIMFAGSPPFSKATITDPYYKLIASSKNEIFWKYHAKHKGNPEFFSENLKDLLNGIFQQNPSQRLTLEQVMKHPWVNDKTNTIEEIQAEFGKRKSMVDSELEKERFRKVAEKQKKEQGAIFTGIGKFRSLDQLQSDFSQVEQQYSLNQDKRQIRIYDENAKQQNDFFTTLDQEYLLRLLLSKNTEFCSEVLKVSPQKYKLTIRSLDANNKLLDLEIELLQANGDLINVDFIKKEGDSLKYYEKINQIKAFISQAGQ